MNASVSGVNRRAPGRPSDGQLLAALSGGGGRAWRIASRFGNEVTPKWVGRRLLILERQGLVVRGASNVVPSEIHWMRAVAAKPQAGAA